MAQLKRYFENPFENKLITFPRLLAFALFHIAKLVANNVGNMYTGIITDTQNKAAALQTALNSEVVEEDQSIGATKGKDDGRTTLQKFISDKEGIIKGTYGKDSVTYKEFFPHGLEAFHQATDQDFVTRVNGFLIKCQNHVADLGSTFVNSVSTAVGDFATASGLHVTESGQVVPAKITVAGAAHALTVQLVTNIFTIGLNNLDGPAQPIVDLFFNEKLLYAEHHEDIIKGHPAPHTTEPVCSFEYKPGKSFHLKNKGAKALGFEFGVNGNLVGNTFTVQPGEEVTKSFPDFYATGDTLMVINNEDVAGDYEVDETI